MNREQVHSQVFTKVLGQIQWKVRCPVWDQIRSKFGIKVLGRIYHKINEHSWHHIYTQTYRLISESVL